MEGYTETADERGVREMKKKKESGIPFPRGY